MTDATSVTRLYTVGERVEPGDYAKEGAEALWCKQPIPGGWVCSIREGHKGPQHVAVGGLTVHAVADRDTSGDEVEGTWKAGDHVRSTPGATRFIAVGTVIDVTERDGIARVDLVGRYLHDEGNWQHLTVDATALEPAISGYTPPTHEQIGKALASTARQAQTLIELAQRDRDRARVELETFRETVRDKAIELARQHNWCGVVDAGLRDMGLEPMRRSYDVEVTITATRTITVRADEVDFDGKDTSEVHDALGWSRVDRAFRAQESESGWSTSEYEVVEWEAVED
jgi:hypothetical protein